MVRPSLLLLLVGCAERAPEDPADWYDPGTPYQVEEPLSFTDQPYDLPAASGQGIGDLLLPAFPQPFGSAVAADAVVSTPCAGWRTTNDLPVTITGVVTVLPQYYIKSSGCGDAEKFYASYFVEDDTGGVLVLNNSRAAMFDAGDVVTMRVDSVSRSFENNLVYGHELLDVQRLGLPVRYTEKQAAFDATDLGRVRRVTGVLMGEPDGFGTMYVQPDGVDTTCVPPASDEDTSVDCAVLTLSTELNRRPIVLSAGQHVRATGPVVSSFGYKLVLTRLGQLEILAD